MLGFLNNLAKAVVGVSMETPIVPVTDVLTLGDAIIDKSQPYTSEALSKSLDNIQKATE